MAAKAATKKKPQGKQITVRLDDASFDSLEELIKREKTTRSAVVKSLLSGYLSGKFIVLTEQLSQMLDHGPWLDDEEKSEDVNAQRLAVIRKALTKVSSARMSDIKQRQEEQQKLGQLQAEVSQLGEDIASRDKIIRALMTVLKEFDF